MVSSNSRNAVPLLPIHSSALRSTSTNDRKSYVLQVYEVEFKNQSARDKFIADHPNSCALDIVARAQGHDHEHCDAFKELQKWDSKLKWAERLFWYFMVCIGWKVFVFFLSLVPKQ